MKSKYIHFKKYFNRSNNMLGNICTLNYRRFIPIGFIIFLTLLVFHFFPCQFRSPHFNRAGTKSPLTKMLVVAHYNEDLDWLNLFIGEQIPYIVYTRSNNSLARHSIGINKGREPVVYLRYIVDHYSNLPSLIAFVHAHRTSWHQKDPSNIVVALRALQWDKYTYMPLTSSITQTTFEPLAEDQQAKVNFELWQAVLEKELGSPPDDGIKAPCCATFVVKREAILAHPKIFYSNIMDYILATSHSDLLTGRTLEYTWHLIFGQPPHINYRSCDLFVCDAKGDISVELAEENE